MLDALGLVWAHVHFGFHGGDQLLRDFDLIRVLLLTKLEMSLKVGRTGNISEISLATHGRQALTEPNTIRHRFLLACDGLVGVVSVGRR